MHLCIPSIINNQLKSTHSAIVCYYHLNNKPLECEAMQNDIDFIWTQIDPLIKEGNLNKALKVYRRLADVGTLQANEDIQKRIEFIQSNGNPFDYSIASQNTFSENAPLTSATENKFFQVEYFLSQGNKIEAIRAYRILTGATLKEAKDAIEHIVLPHIQSPYRSNSFDPLAFEQGKDKSSKIIYFLLGLALLAILGAIFLPALFA